MTALAPTPPPSSNHHLVATIHEKGSNDDGQLLLFVNPDCKLDLKTISLHARNAEYNPKVGTWLYLTHDMMNGLMFKCFLAFCSHYHVYSCPENMPENDSLNIRIGKDGHHWCQIGGWFAAGIAKIHTYCSETWFQSKIFHRCLSGFMYLSLYLLSNSQLFYLVLLVFTLSYKFYYLFICLGLDILKANLLRLTILIFLHFLIDQFTK